MIFQLNVNNKLMFGIAESWRHEPALQYAAEVVAKQIGIYFLITVFYFFFLICFAFFYLFFIFYFLFF